MHKVNPKIAVPLLHQHHMLHSCSMHYHKKYLVLLTHGLGSFPGIYDTLLFLNLCTRCLVAISSKMCVDSSSILLFPFIISLGLHELRWIVDASMWLGKTTPVGCGWVCVTRWDLGSIWVEGVFLGLNLWPCLPDGYLGSEGRASAYLAEGCRFESHRSPLLPLP